MNSNSGTVDVEGVGDASIENETLTLTAGGQSDTLGLTDAVPTVTYTASTNTPVSEGSNIQYTIVATEVNGGSYEDVTVTITGTASSRVTAGDFAITAAEFTSGSGTVTKNYSVINNLVYQGNENVTLDAVGDTYGNSAPQQTVTITDATATLISVTGPTPINDGGSAPSFTVDINPSVLESYMWFFVQGTTTSESATIRFVDDFTIRGKGNFGPGGTNNTSEVSNGNWLTGSGAVASDFDIRATLNGSVLADGTYSVEGTFGTWFNFGTATTAQLTWSLTADASPAGTLSTADIKFEIRDASTLSILDTYNSYDLKFQIDEIGNG
jgi:hypothetical protein